ncbi:helicase [Olsenella sp. AM39-30AC]|uniref:type ISP restriction/modification enzyme n=1 Tax=Olsenella sp. AM39-30AC TaxID=2292360 RepID=UPI000E5035DA|nr:type ISP restriction/modification enzyme [Olsenella sp. AM39-30AC]RHB55749.1 helicase [Olsenella sp. AM39-30AC]
MTTGQTRIVTFDDVMGYLSSHDRTNAEKGDLWERVTAWYLRNDPAMRQVVGRVWRWNDSDNPLRAGHDTGIDIVAERADRPGTYWAVQCKFYDPAHELSYRDLGTFFAAAEADDRYTGLVVASVGEDISGTLESHLLTLRQNRGTDSSVLTPADMRQSNVDWSLLMQGRAEDEGARRARTFSPRPHQLAAINQIQSCFESHDRAKAIMACGTGKTLMSLRLAEERYREQGCRDVLFCAPSIALVSQAMREWSNQARVEMRPLVVCSDAKASSVGDDDVLDSVVDVSFPANTDARSLRERYAWTRGRFPEAMVVVFTTYQSMQVVQDAQEMGLPRFGLCVCDEAHRTAGTRYAEDEDVASFQIVIDGERIRADKRLFMTATPKIYGDNVRTRAEEKAAELYSMDDEGKYGPIAYELTFADAVEQGLLCDYRVVVLAINEDAVPGSRIVVPHGQGEAELEVGDAAKIIGCWRGLATHGEEAARRLDAYEGDEAELTPDFLLVDDFDEQDVDRDAISLDDEGERIEPLHRAVGFCSTIQASKDIDAAFSRVVSDYVRNTGEHGPQCELDHVDGSMDSKLRAKKLEWLASGDGEDECRILTNARCLAEGVDVPSLDAVIFFSPKRSKVDVVQAVGRVMRTFTNRRTGEEKRLGYIILPVVIPSEMTPEEALNRSDTFDVVWGVLQALRSHDQRIDAYVNSLPMRKPRKKDKGLGIGGKSGRPDGGEDSGGDAGTGTGDASKQTSMDLFGTTALERAVYAKAVEKCGSKVYWSSWAEDVGRIARTHVEQIDQAIEADPVAAEAMDAFLKSLRDSLNPGITREAAVEMVAQHMVTLPVFDALFGDYAFAGSNPVSVAITEFLEELRGHGVGDMGEDDRRSLDELYASVRRRASFCRTDSNRQALIKELYNDFFSKAFTKTSEKLGIVYTPIEIVDCILHMTDRAMRREFGKGLSDPGVHVLDPFAGTGSFMAELVSDPELMPRDRLAEKYLHELHSNEILLLAYYIMVVNVEYAYHSRMGGDYVPFEGAVLTDTFQMDERNDELDLGMFVDNSERVLREQEAPIRVIVGNPPYSEGQKSANDNNANENYPSLRDRIKDTYSANTGATNKKPLMDSYIEAFRWASDRIGNDGIVCFVSNAGWLRSEAGAGVRRCFSEEFSSIYVFDLLGNQRTQGEESRRQGGKVFGSGSRAPIAITMLVKNPSSNERGAIRYHCVGEYLTQQQKLSAVASCIDRDPEWETLSQDRHGDWLDQRDDDWYEFAPLSVNACNGIYSTHMLGVGTNRDSWVYSFSTSNLNKRMATFIETYNTEVEKAARDGWDFDKAEKNPTAIKWSSSLQNHCKSGVRDRFSSGNIVTALYRPFCKQWCYVDSIVIHRPAIINKYFPLMQSNELAGNVVIMVPGKSNTGFNCLVSTTLPDLNLMNAGTQCFPYYWYEKDEGSTMGLAAGDGEKVVRDAWGNRYVRHDAITDEALRVFREAYPHAFANRAMRDGGPGVSKEDVFWYVYGILHSPEYRTRFAANLQRELPRIPLVDHFETFCEAGRALGDLHLNYESVEPWPALKVSGVLPGEDPGPVTKLAWGRRRDPETGRTEKDFTRLVYNSRVTVSNIPESAQGYVVNGRSPLDWVIDRYQVKTDRATGIANDPNEYSEDPRYVLDLICRLVTVSMRTNDIVAQLPPLREVARPAGWPAAWSMVPGEGE